MFVNFQFIVKCVPPQERVNLARQIEKIEFHNSREKQHNSWLRQAADALEVELDDDLLLGKVSHNAFSTSITVQIQTTEPAVISPGRGARDEDHDRGQQKMVKEMKKHLKHLISQPIFKNVNKTKYPTQMGKLSLPHVPLAEMESALTSVSIEKNKDKLKKEGPPQKKKKKAKKSGSSDISETV